MKKYITFVLLLFGSAVVAVGQGSVPPTAATPTPMLGVNEDKAINAGRNISSRSNELRMSEKFPVRTEKDRKIYNEMIKPRYRRSTKEERASIAPDKEVKNNNRAFLSDKKAGIIRLVPDIGCLTKDDVVSGTPQCTKYTMPGAGSAYSFREKDYRIKRLADINFRKNKFQAFGTLVHGIMVDLGDVPINEVTLKSDGLKHLQKIKPSANFSEAGAFADKLIKGYEKDKYRYASVVNAEVNRTYVLRSIAYRGLAPKSVGGIVYNEMSFDKRKDLIVVFRVVDIKDGQGATIIWKELKSKKSKVLEAPK